MYKYFITGGTVLFLSLRLMYIKILQIWNFIMLIKDEVKYTLYWW